MSLNRLKKLSKLKHISDFDSCSLITDFALYESAVIDLRAVVLTECEEPRAEVSSDIQMLQHFLLDENPIMLPCPECEREMPFKPMRWINPRILENTLPIKQDKKKSAVIKNLGDSEEICNNVFDITSPYFTLYEPTLVSFNESDLEFIKDNETKKKFLCECTNKCRNYFLYSAPEIRRDYVCSLHSEHRMFANFRIYDPIELYDRNEYSNALEEGEDDATQAFEFLSDCLIIQKVGQYPSLADLQMFDVEKYRTVLGKDSYRDLTRAIGLNANGIGCGSFLYLRRILERLVEEAHQEEKIKAGWNEEVYGDSQFNERIQMLEESGHNIIPESLADVKNKIYGVLSKGVHESTDDECMELFPYMQFVIEQILDERIRKKEFNQKIAKLKGKLN